MIWVVAFILSIPQLVFLQSINVNSLGGIEKKEFLPSDKDAVDELEEIYICEIVWPQPNFEKILQPIDAVILFLVPLAIVFVIYVKIVFKMRAIDGKRLPPARRVFVKQRKCAIRKMIAVIAIFALCHLPIHVFHLLLLFFLPDLGGTRDRESMAVFSVCEPGTRYSRHKSVCVRLNSPLLRQL